MASNSLRLEHGILPLQGALDRDAVTALWPRLQPVLGQLHGVDLTAVSHIDSAGVALLAALAARARSQGQALVVTGAPAGLDELSAAYRLGTDLDFTASTAAS